MFLTTEERVQINHPAPLKHDMKSQTISFSKVAVVSRINGPAEQWFRYGGNRSFLKNFHTLPHSKATDKIKR